MDCAKKSWVIGKDDKGYPVYKEGKKFLQVSTDEVYGSLEKDIPDGKELFFEEEDLNSLIKGRAATKTFGSKFFTEDSPMMPNSPYSASKASADMLVSAYFKTYHFQIGRAPRLNSSHANISYAVFCLKKKKKNIYEKRHNHN